MDPYVAFRIGEPHGVQLCAPPDAEEACRFHAGDFPKYRLEFMEPAR